MEEGYKGENKKIFEFNKRITITRLNNNGIDVPYLKRHTLFSFSKYFSIKVHDIVDSDEICSHDHPWPFLTIMLRGGYYEWTPKSQKERGKILEERIGTDGTIEVRRWHGPGSIMYRPANWRHQLELPVEYKTTFNGDSEKPLPAKTFVLTFKVIRDWGFFTPKGWIYWDNYDKNKDCQ
jgi:hypothetical protein